MRIITFKAIPFSRIVFEQYKNLEPLALISSYIKAKKRSLCKENCTIQLYRDVQPSFL